MISIFNRYSNTPPTRHIGAESIFVAILTCVLVSLMGVSLSRLQNASFQSLFSSETTMQAQHFARSKMDYLIYKGYNELTIQDKTPIDGSTFKDAVALGNVITDTDGVSHRLVTVIVYNKDETQPRAKLQQLFYSNDANRFVVNGNSPTASISLNYDADTDKLYAKVNGEEKVLDGSNGVPVGTVIAWASNNTIPTENGIWLECNGQDCSVYPKLIAVLGKSTVPDYRGRFLQADAVAGNTIEAGLPNITAETTTNNESTSDENCWGAFYSSSNTSLWYGDNIHWSGIRNLAFDASRSNPIYGASDTVQPPAVTVRYFIKAQ